MTPLTDIVWRNLNNLFGWHTNRKIVVIESDDWGSIRMPSIDAYNYLIKHGYRVNEGFFERYDSLESSDDLEVLYEVLGSVKDSHNNPAVMTANSVMVNPDFDKIKRAHFQTYHYEFFYDSYNKQNKTSNTMQLIQEGLKNGLFVPQFHGREHFNIPMWMHDLQNGDKDAHFVFNLGMAGTFPKEELQNNNKYVNAYAGHSQEDEIFYRNSIREGLDIFKDIWGFSARSFKAPCYTWSKKIEFDLNEKNIQLIQGSIFQLEPHNPKEKKILHYSGEKNKYGQIYNVRNCFFEPTSRLKRDWVSSCLNQINNAFFWKKPAIICSHRVNYVGKIDKTNRDKNIKELKKLLVGIKKKWPSVEFLSSDKLIETIVNKKSI